MSPRNRKKTTKKQKSVMKKNKVLNINMSAEEPNVLAATTSAGRAAGRRHCGACRPASKVRALPSPSGLVL